MPQENQQGREENSSLTRTYSNPGLSVEALRAKRIDEQRDEIFELIVKKSRDALETIEDVMMNSEDDGHRLKAAQDILNRGGMKQIHEISVTHTNTASPTEVIMDKINSLVPSDSGKDIVDAEVLDSEDEPDDKQN